MVRLYYGLYTFVLVVLVVMFSCQYTQADTVVYTANVLSGSQCEGVGVVDMARGGKPVSIVYVGNGASGRGLYIAPFDYNVMGSPVLIRSYSDLDNFGGNSFAITGTSVDGSGYTIDIINVNDGNCGSYQGHKQRLCFDLSDNYQYVYYTANCYDATMTSSFPLNGTTYIKADGGSTLKRYTNGSPTGLSLLGFYPFVAWSSDVDDEYILYYINSGNIVGKYMRL